MHGPVSCSTGAFVFQDGPTLPSRRSLLTGDTEETSFQKWSEKTKVTLGLPCRCCERDWCATSCFETKCNCYEFLSELVSSEQKVVSGGLYKLPSDASKARLDAMDAGLGEEAWASPLEHRRGRGCQLAVFAVVSEDGSHLKVKPSSLSGAGDGLFATEALPANTVCPGKRGD
eukprot:Skav200709  [mRNA]  locus=scaffold2650:63845:66055:- [translate_table: standard]